MLSEPQVVSKVHEFLKNARLCSRRTLRLYTDTHHTLLKNSKLKPFQRFTIDADGFVLHPDMVGTFDDGETIFAVEAKGSEDLTKGLGQVQYYQQATHAAFLCADKNAIAPGLVSMARRLNIGLLAVSSSVEVFHEPQLHAPIYEYYKGIRSQLDSANTVSGVQAFQFNLPTHYLVWSIALQPGQIYTRNSLSTLDGYSPLPQDYKAALSGAARLGLVSVQGDDIRLTDMGVVAKQLLPKDLQQWTRIHKMIASRRNRTTLASASPESAAVLRLLLLQEPAVTMLIEGLELLDRKKGSFLELAKKCDAVNHARAQVFFFQPKALNTILDTSGQIHWAEVRPEHYRSRMFFQFKSILKHAGIIAPHALGGASVRGFKPCTDIWELRQDT